MKIRRIDFWLMTKGREASRDTVFHTVAVFGEFSHIQNTGEIRLIRLRGNSIVFSSNKGLNWWNYRMELIWAIVVNMIVKSWLCIPQAASWYFSVECPLISHCNRSKEEYPRFGRHFLAMKSGHFDWWCDHYESESLN